MGVASRPRPRPRSGPCSAFVVVLCVRCSASGPCSAPVLGVRLLVFPRVQRAARIRHPCVCKLLVWLALRPSLLSANAGGCGITE